MPMSLLRPFPETEASKRRWSPPPPMPSRTPKFFPTHPKTKAPRRGQSLRPVPLFLPANSEIRSCDREGGQKDCKHCGKGHEGIAPVYIFGPSIEVVGLLLV